MGVERLIDQRRLERVEADPGAAQQALAEAAKHADSAELIANDDPNGAFQLAYDAGRKAVMAHMRRAGVRVRRGEGGHATTADYAAAAIDPTLGERLDRMRRRRSRSEYGTAYFEGDEVREAIAVARALISASS